MSREVTNISTTANKTIHVVMFHDSSKALNWKISQ